MKSSRRQHKPAKKKTSSSEDRYHHGDLRRALLDEALRVLAKGGFKALSLRDLARRVGVTHAAPYRHFTDKSALVRALAEEGFLALLESTRTASADERIGTAAHMTSIGLGYVRFAVENPSHFRLMFGPIERNGGLVVEIDEALAAASRASFEALTSAIAACQASGVLRTGDPHVLATSAWAIVHGLSMLLVDGVLPVDTSDPAAVDAATRPVIDLFHRGAAGPRYDEP
jgi:AcrR family transcriptional regulator